MMPPATTVDPCGGCNAISRTRRNGILRSSTLLDSPAPTHARSSPLHVFEELDCQINKVVSDKLNVFCVVQWTCSSMNLIHFLRK